MQAGDIAITSVTTDNSDAFEFLALKDIAEGETVTFTDAGWIGNGSGFRANEGAVKWTAPTGGVAAGTLISLTENADQFSEANGADVGNNGMNLSVSGDQVLAFTGDAAAPTFLFAVQTNSNEWQAEATSSNDSGLPEGLVVGETAVAAGKGPGAGEEWDNVAYTGPASGSAADLLAAIADKANWAGDHSAKPAGAVTAFELENVNRIDTVAGDHDITLNSAITDVLVFAASTEIGNDSITDFTAGADGDVLDFTAWLDADDGNGNRVETTLGLQDNGVLITTFNALDGSNTTNFTALTETQLANDVALLSNQEKAVVMVENDENLGQYKVFEVTSDGSANTADLLGSLDFGSNQTFAVDNFA